MSVLSFEDERERLMDLLFYYDLALVVVVVVVEWMGFDFV